MKHLISRENYIIEHLHNTESVENTNELDEGLLSTVFGGLKMLLKKDWVNIKCKNPTVLEYLKEIDKNLSGYTLTKMEFSSECKNIRQNVADYFNDILDYKLLQIEKAENVDKFIENEDEEIDKNGETNSVSKLLNIKDDTLLDTLNQYKKNISIACKKSSKLREYADQMLNSVVVFVNDIVIKELEKKGADKKKLEKKRKKNEEDEKKLKEIRDKMNKLADDAGKEAIDKLADERDKSLRNINVKPIGAMSGDKSINIIYKQFSDMLGEFNPNKLYESILKDGIDKVLDSDIYIGIKSSLENLKWDSNNEDENLKNHLLIKIIMNKINTVFGVISKNKSMFVDVPSASVQAMMVSLSNVIIYGFMGGDKFPIENDKDRISLLTKCLIDSDATIGFNLPLIDPKKPDNGNFFLGIMNQFKNENISSKEIEEIISNIDKKDIKKIAKLEGIKMKETSDFTKKFVPKIMKEFRQNISELFDLILKESKKIKEDAKKSRT